MIPFLYNTCYGGFAFSKEFEEEFSKRFPEKKEFLQGWSDKKRYDTDVVALWKEMGEKANGSHSKINVKMVPENCVDFIHIREYDGMENVVIDWTFVYTSICHRLVEAVKNRHDIAITNILHEYDEIKDTYREYSSSK